MNDEDARARWQLHMLNRLGSLSEEWQARFDELRARYGDPPEPHRGAQEGWVGSQPPVAQADLAAMAVTDIVAYLSSWHPAGGWQSPSPEGLGRVLSQVVATDPERFASEARTFIDLDPTYVRSLLGGLREAKRNGLTFAWREVLDLCQATLDKPREIEGRDARQLADLDPGWSWTWQESLRLIQAGMQDGDGCICAEHRALVWSVIEVLSADRQLPAVATRDDDGTGPATRALNSTRGVAMHAAFQYGWWLRAVQPDDPRRLPAKLAQLLTLHLDVAKEPSDAIRSIYGQWFPNLVSCDARFAAQQVSTIFPAEPELANLWRAAWNSYVRLNRLWPTAYELLGDQYRRAISELESPSSDDQLLGDSGEALVTHLMSLYWQGLIDFGSNDGLLDDFYARASVERRAQALEALGHGLVDAGALAEDGARRLRALWQRRLAAVQESGNPDAAAELRGYAWWFGSGHLEPDWALAQLRMMLESGGRVEADHVVAERLALLRSSHPLAVVRALELLVETGTREWFVLGSREEITAILTEALAAGGESEARARDLTNRLVARGHREYNELLQG